MTKEVVSVVRGPWCVAWKQSEGPVLEQSEGPLLERRDPQGRRPIVSVSSTEILTFGY